MAAHGGRSAGWGKSNSYHNMQLHSAHFRAFAGTIKEGPLAVSTADLPLRHSAENIPKSHNFQIPLEYSTLHSPLTKIQTLISTLLLPVPKDYSAMVHCIPSPRKDICILGGDIVKFDKKRHPAELFTCGETDRSSRGQFFFLLSFS